jgi:dTDP-4-amino-4,6-dideoxygalactose transaminase
LSHLAPKRCKCKNIILARRKNKAVKEIGLVELKLQYQRLKNDIDASISQVLESTSFVQGPAVKNFEQNLAAYLSVKHVIGCANGTDALQIAMMSRGYSPGDEIITASFTYIATAEVIAFLRLKPVLVEVNPDTFTLEPAAIEAAITSKTRAIVPVHLYGQSANMETILEIAEKHGLDVIEDNAQAIGADFIFSNGSKKKTGTLGIIGTTSFYPSKNLGAYGDGGALFTDDDEVAARLRMLGNHGQKSLYMHDEIGVNSRLDSLQAAILNVKLKHLDDFARSRVAVADYYDAAFKDLKNVQIPVRAPYSTHVFHQYTLKLENADRDKVIKQLAAKGIPARVYYPVPVHLQKAFQKGQRMEGKLPVTEKLCQSVLSLPIHTEMDEKQLEYIAASFIDIIR